MANDGTPVGRINQMLEPDEVLAVVRPAAKQVSAIDKPVAAQRN